MSGASPLAHFPGWHLSAHPSLRARGPQGSDRCREAWWFPGPGALRASQCLPRSQPSAPKSREQQSRQGHGPGSPLGRVCWGSEETQAGKAAGLETSPVCTGRARHSRGVGGPRPRQTQPVDMPPWGPGMRAHTAIPGPSHGHPQVGSELCTSLRGDILLWAIPRTPIGAPTAPGGGSSQYLLPWTWRAGPRAGGPHHTGQGPFKADRGPESAPHPPST